MAIKCGYPNANVFNQAFLNIQITHDVAYGANLQVQFMGRNTGLG